MNPLKEFLKKIVEESEYSMTFYQQAQADLARQILSEYLTGTKFCQCELCKKQHELIQEGK